jgi:hypothetical protein
MSGTRGRRVLGVFVLTAGLLLIVERVGTVAALVAAR